MKIHILSITLALLVCACGPKSEPTTNRAEPSAKSTEATTTPEKDAETKEAETTEAETTEAEPTEAEESAPPIPAPAGLFACKAPADAVTATLDPDNPWALPYAVTGCPTIPPIFGDVVFGMDRAAVATAFGPGAKVDEGSLAHLYLGKSPHELMLSVRFSDSGKVEAFAHKIDAEGFEVLKAAWGEPLLVSGLVRSALYWYNPKMGLRVRAESSKWDRKSAKEEAEEVDGHYLYYERYTPLSVKLGARGLIGKDLIGKSVEELHAIFPDGLDDVSAEEGQARFDNLGLDADTVARMNALGHIKAATDLVLPANETEVLSSGISIDWVDDKVSRYSFLVEFGDDEALKTEILAVAAKTLRALTGSKRDGDGFSYIFSAPHRQVVTVESGLSGKGWRFEVSKP